MPETCKIIKKEQLFFLLIFKITFLWNTSGGCLWSVLFTCSYCETQIKSRVFHFRKQNKGNLKYMLFYKFGPKNWSSPNWLKFGTYVHCYVIITILMFIFRRFWSLFHKIFLGKFGPIILIFSNWLKFCRGMRCYMLITVFIFIFSKFWSRLLYVYFELNF